MPGICEQHWISLKQEIEKQELTHLCAATADEAKKMLANNVFEPLMWAHNSLAGLAFDIVGPLDGCPICNLMNVDWCAQAALRAKQQYLILLAEENSIEKPN